MAKLNPERLQRLLDGRHDLKGFFVGAQEEFEAVISFLEVDAEFLHIGGRRIRFIKK